jgi:hypothetical protein
MLNLFRNGAVGFIDWLDAERAFIERSLTTDERQKKNHCS